MIGFKSKDKRKSISSVFVSVFNVSVSDKHQVNNNMTNIILCIGNKIPVEVLMCCVTAAHQYLFNLYANTKIEFPD